MKQSWIFVLIATMACTHREPLQSRAPNSESSLKPLCQLRATQVLALAGGPNLEFAPPMNVAPEIAACTTPQEVLNVPRVKQSLRQRMSHFSSWQLNFLMIEETKSIAFRSAFSESKPDFSRSYAKLFPEHLALMERGRQKAAAENDLRFAPVMRLGIARICADVAPSTPGCAPLTRKILTDVMMPTTSLTRFNKIAALPLWSAILGGAYFDGLVRFNDRLSSRIAQASIAPGENVFTDLAQSFREVGDDATTAADKAIDVLGLIATSGANFGGRVEQLGLKMEAELFVVNQLAVALPYLDFHSRERLYSLPESFVSECDTSKTYHFWMAAFLSRQLVRSKASPVAAAAAVLAAHIGYRINDDSFLADLPADHPAAFLIQADLAYAFGGALFGGGALASAERSIPSFADLIGRLNAPAAMTPGRLELWADWLGAARARAYFNLMSRYGIARTFASLTAVQPTPQ